MQNLEQAIRDLTQRVQALEDELAIHRLIVRYGLAVDVGDAETAAAVFREDGVYDVDVGVMKGRKAVAQMVQGNKHQSMLPNCAHQIGPAVVEVSGDRAVATGYSRVYLRRGNDIGVYRVSFNRWELDRCDGRWLIARRTTRLLGHEEAKAVFQRALAAAHLSTGSA
jgi:uncharacterized protein (TIGR02246 family)